MDTIPLETSVYGQIEHCAQICRINWNSAHLLLGLEILTQNPHERTRYLALAFGLGLFMSDWQFEKQLWALRVAIVGPTECDSFYNWIGGVDPRIGNEPDACPMPELPATVQVGLASD